jgi:hypothetical protein
MVILDGAGVAGAAVALRGAHPVKSTAAPSEAAISAFLGLCLELLLQRDAVGPRLFLRWNGELATVAVRRVDDARSERWRRSLSCGSRPFWSKRQLSEDEATTSSAQSKSPATV